MCCLGFDTDTALFCLQSQDLEIAMHGRFVTDVIVVMLLLLVGAYTVKCNETNGSGIHMASGSDGSSGGSGDVDGNSTFIMPSVSLSGPTSTPPNSPTDHTTSTAPPVGFKLVLIVAGGAAGALLFLILLFSCCCCCWYYKK